MKIYKYTIMIIFFLLLVMKATNRAYGDLIQMTKEYFSYKNIQYVSYLSCADSLDNVKFAKTLSVTNARSSIIQIDRHAHISIEKALYQRQGNVGVYLDGSCDNATYVLQQASRAKMLDASHAWLVRAPQLYNVTLFIEEHFQNLNLSIDADVAVVDCDEAGYTLTDVYNFGKIQGNWLEITSLGSWRPDYGLNISLKGFKYYNRWNFHNLTLRAITVMLEQPAVFQPALLSSVGYTPGVAPMTKITSQLLNLLKEQHNFRFRYTIVDRWIGSPKRNSTLAVTNSLYWGEQDISSTSARIFPLWLNWVDICFPPTTNLQTKFYYVMVERGVGEYENRFLAPLSLGAWCSTAAAALLCAATLAAAATLEARPNPAAYGFFSVTAALSQQDFDDGMQEQKLSSQGRKLTLVVAGLTSMLIYNYYTSSVVSWLLSAPAPSIDSLAHLLDSRLELIFEDIGYTRGWLDNPGFYYYSGYVNPIEDQLRNVKITKAKRTVSVLQPVSAGVELIRTGLYAYHTEPYAASQAIPRRYREEELCTLGSLQMMQPAPVYVMVQKRSPYREFFVWSLLRLSERGHVAAVRQRFAGTIPACSGRKPRALALGQAAPAFLLLLVLAALSIGVLVPPPAQTSQMEGAKTKLSSVIAHKTYTSHLYLDDGKNNKEGD